MGRRGPQPMPTNLRVLHGDHLGRINRDEPKPRAALPECPADASDKVKAVWDYSVRELAAMKILTSADRDTLLIYCEAIVTHREASDLIAKTSILVRGANGGLVKNPALSVQASAARIAIVCAREFGLTPSARTLIKVAEAGRGKGDDLLTA